MMDWTTIAIGGFLLSMTFVASAHATPLATQDERYITCGTEQERQTAFGLAHELGATHIRINAREGHCDPVQAALETAGSGLFRPQVTVLGDVSWATHLARTLGPYVKTWSVWNEPNISGWQWGTMQSGSPLRYRRLYTRVRETIQKNDPGARVLFGELAPWRVTDFIRRSVRGVRKPVRADGLAIHPYPWALPNKSLSGHLQRLKLLLTELAQKRKLMTPKGRPLPIWITEFGVIPDNTYRPDNYWHEARAEGVRQFSQYQLLDTGQKWDTAVVENDGTKRPEWDALKGFK
jgi:hypothetical protein